MENTSDRIDELLDQLSAIVSQFKTLPDENKIKNIHREFAPLAKQLKAEITALPGVNSSYDFYILSSQLIEKISELRVNKNTRNALTAAGTIALFDELVADIKSVVNRHPEIHIDQPQPTTTDSPEANLLERLQAQAELASHQAAAATKASTEANERSANILKVIQQEAAGNQGVLSQAAMDKLQSTNLLMVAKNTAAVIAADAAAKAIGELEDLLE